MKNPIEQFSHEALDEIADHLDRIVQWDLDSLPSGMTHKHALDTVSGLRKIAKEVRRLKTERLVEELTGAE
jgi:hypothetical protein